MIPFPDLIGWLQAIAARDPGDDGRWRMGPLRMQHTCPNFAGGQFVVGDGYGTGNRWAGKQQDGDRYDNAVHDSMVAEEALIDWQDVGRDGDSPVAALDDNRPAWLTIE